MFQDSGKRKQKIDTKQSEEDSAAWYTDKRVRTVREYVHYHFNNNRNLNFFLSYGYII